MIRARVPLIRLGLIGLLAPAIACAMPPVEVQALLPDRAMLRVAGTGYLLLEGESTPQGVRLVAADAGSALVEYAGRQHRLQLGALVQRMPRPAALEPRQAMRGAQPGQHGAVAIEKRAGIAPGADYQRGLLLQRTQPVLGVGEF